MPPGYRTRIEEVERLTKDLDDMLRFGRLLYTTGPMLGEAVRDVFTTLKLEVETVPCGEVAVGAVHLGGKRRLLIHVSASADLLEKKSPDVAAAFQILHELGGEQDRVLLAANPHGGLPPAKRPDPATAEAVDMLQRLGVNLVTGPSFFQLWSERLQDPARAAKLVGQLHDQDGGVFPGFQA